ncbi:MAG: hypothetical protein Q8N53_16170 [Longimicrobiales bacterium]|nr:hypothetical protein [Longimicrobiales bacterium]
MEITVRALHVEQDYEVVLAGDRLDVLVTLVEAYEARHWLVAGSRRSCPEGAASRFP